jgi:PncC family amidohydrolase
MEFELYDLLKEYNITITTAESATGGMIASTLVNVPGISGYFKEGYITYSDEAKIKLLGVDKAVIDIFGVVSRQTAEAMADGAARNAGTRAAISVTGVAGPDGGSKDCPVGTVYIGCHLDMNTVCEHHLFEGDRASVRKQAAEAALKLMIRMIKDESTRIIK